MAEPTVQGRCQVLRTGTAISKCVQRIIQHNTFFYNTVDYVAKNAHLPMTYMLPLPVGITELSKMHSMIMKANSILAVTVSVEGKHPLVGIARWALNLP